MVSDISQAAITCLQKLCTGVLSGFQPPTPKYRLPGWLSSKASAWMQEMQETRVQSLDWEDSLEEEMATHSSSPAWKIPLTEEPGGLQSMGSQSQARLSMHTYIHASKHKLAPEENQ